ncbi:sigma-70 family RNA polymerase sigma factor [Marinomonas pollencensis]|uniref:RNA polymerase sigma-70 factor (ECF subfamily) n=1 Tax=Marinomonas pollencensis TaxID=491954 RepID=A0A3E0DI84_9GAMM|nr:sigma-70 family RNA polymerase sigma factor [Marinomonas pollencensis]REG82394.1 RNA polymerase sigma-70 factor (ECF subfamily) [Marinomonas pollencensis]
MERAKQTQAEGQLVQDMQAVAEHRDQAALTRLFDHYVPKIRAFCLAAQPGANLMADDIAQEVMIRIWRKAHCYNPELAALNTWVFTLVRNVRIDYFRKNGRHQTNIDSDYVFQEIVDESADPFQRAQTKRDQEQIKHGMSKLPEDQKQVLHKVYLEGKTHKEAALELSLPLGTIKSRVRLALHKLTIHIKR